MNTKEEFEKSFEDFLYSQNYDAASEMMFLLARSAFLSGYLSAGGNDGGQEAPFSIIKGNKKEER